MKTPVRTIVIVVIALVSSTQSRAQLSMISNNHYEAKQKIAVDLKVTPSVKDFRAGISLVDSMQNKFRLWICNAEEKRCNISISSSAGYLWNLNLKDAYYNQLFDLSSLDDGEYLIRVITDKDRFEKKITITTNNYIKRDMKID